MLSAQDLTNKKTHNVWHGWKEDNNGVLECEEALTEISYHGELYVVYFTHFMNYTHSIATRLKNISEKHKTTFITCLWRK